MLRKAGGEQQAKKMTATRGRPRLPADKRKVLMTVMLEPSQRQLIEKLSSKLGRSLGDVYREALGIGLQAMNGKVRGRNGAAQRDSSTSA